MGKLYRYFEPPDKEIILSEDEILERFYQEWCEKMVKVGREYLITPQHCIEDFICIHYATPYGYETTSHCADYTTSKE